ncbi:ATP-dependent helicase [Blattabacterium cuenoti]|uniref:ATP-dependent helicase n=1 Tax=Blattabacterium cuenoti TaxID=1653831 RepID=UPI00163C2F3C|nr:UvrD-helicase domain-containing protein [Blattabacterium cuenoti]
MKLNEIQKKIVKTIYGPVLVIAGAGSGKTRVLVYRIIYMIKNIGIKPSNILALTFTKKAAEEMKNRISNLIDKSLSKKIKIGTFHSIFSNILRKESHYIGFNPDYTIYDRKDSENIIKKILKNLNLDKSFNYKDILKKISLYKNNFFLKKKIENPFKKIYDLYTLKCFQSKAIDFDDILLYTYRLFYLYPKVLNKYQEKFKYILVDEYQDTNSSQSIIIKFLSKKYNNIFVVGDDAQSIYNFRGANISNIKNFHIEYKKTKIFYLEQNYRSTNYIVQISNKIISFNKNQILKKIWTNNEQGEKIKIYEASSEKEEVLYIIDSILSIIKKKKYEYKDFAIFYRTNSQSYIIEYLLKERKIPYKIYGNISLIKRKEIQNLLLYLKFINNPNDEELLLRILQKNNIRHKKTINFILKLIEKYKKYNIFDILSNIDLYDKKSIINKKTKCKIKKIFFLLKIIFLKKENINVYEIIKDIINLILLEQIKEEKNKNYYIHQLYYFFTQKIKLKERISLSKFLQNFYFDNKIYIDEKKEIENKVSLMTIHLSKGLEFPIVFITGLEENIFPSRSNINEISKIEEERRLFYVAITRAKKLAILTYAKCRLLWGEKKNNIPSRFIKEIKNNDHIISYDKKEKEYNFIKKGIKVFHKKFGVGIILYLKYNNQIAIIDFQKLGKKKILLSLNKLTFYP